jgi:hypothetical protein
MRLLGRLSLMIAALNLLTGCSYYRQYKFDQKLKQAKQTESMLTAAGFVTVTAASDQQKNLVASLPPLQLHHYPSRKGMIYWYSDPYSCKCVMRGDQAAYTRYQQILIQKEMVDEAQQAALMNEEAAQENQMMMLNSFSPFMFP